jgi:hypothetical protein
MDDNEKVFCVEARLDGKSVLEHACERNEKE